MAEKKKNWWYVLVMTNDGPKFVTKNDYKTKFSHWEGTEKPLEMSMSEAKDVAFGLCMNFYFAFPVCSLFELDTQPYDYKNFDCTFVRKESEDAESDSED